MAARRPDPPPAPGPDAGKQPAARVAAFNATVIGRVQGVGFRYCACREADRLRLTGWVRNTDEGDVEVHAEGPPEALEAFSRWLHSGPPGARVETVHLQPCTPYNCYTAFSVEF